METYCFFLGLVILINIVRIIISKQQQQDKKNSFYLTWKVLFNNVLIMLIYYYIKENETFKIKHIENYFIGIILFQLLFITIIKDVLNYLTRQDTTFFKLFLLLRHNLDKKDLKKIIDLLKKK